MTTEQLLRLATYASVATATVLIAAKVTAWFATGSVSVLASLVDSVMDVGASLINLFAVRYSLMFAAVPHALAAIFNLLAARTLREDLARAEAAV